MTSVTIIPNFIQLACNQTEMYALDSAGQVWEFQPANWIYQEGDEEGTLNRRTEPYWLLRDWKQHRTPPG